MSEITIYRQLASLQTSVEHLAGTMRDMASQWANQETAATAGRIALHEKVEMVRQELGVQVAGLSLRVDRLADKVTTIEPSVTTFKDKMKEDREAELLSEGARQFRVKVGAWIVAGASAVGWGLHELVSYIKH